MFEEVQAQYNVCVQLTNVCSNQVGGCSLSIVDMDYTKTNIKPPGTHNFMSVLDRDKIFQKPSYDYYKEAVSRRFGSQFYNFTSKFNIGGLSCIGHPGILQHLQESDSP